MRAPISIISSIGSIKIKARIVSNMAFSLKNDRCYKGIKKNNNINKMSEHLIYTLDLAGNLQDNLRKIIILNDEHLDKWSKVQTKVVSANRTMNNMGKSIGSINERIAALKAQKEWIPASNREAIRATNLEIKSLDKEVNKLHSLNGGVFKKLANDIKTAIPSIELIANPIALIGAGAYRLTQYLGSSKQAYMEESVEVAKLTRIMQNTMGARQDEVDSIMALASAQQKLGVVGDETQMAGAQELATYLERSSSLKKLLPVMNDMMAQQYGINATQEQAQNIGMMLGKVMQGQTGALSRYGYQFTEAQERILKYGNEAERAAMLAEVVGESVGGVNEALATTPEGKLKQTANNMGDLQERVGSLMVAVQSAFSPLVGTIGEILDKVIGFFESNRDKIVEIVSKAAEMLQEAIGAVWSVVEKVAGAVSWFIGELRDGNTVIVGIAASIGGIVAALMLWSAWNKIVAITQTIIAVTNPVTLIIAGLVALIAVIAYVAYTTTGWGQTWKNVMQWMKLGITLFKDVVKLQWLNIKNDFLTGFEVIDKGWYKLQSLWDKSSAQEGLARMEAERNQRAEEMLKLQSKIKDTAKDMSAIDVWQIRSNGKMLKDISKDIGIKLGINTNLIDAVNGSGGVGSGAGGSGGESTNNAIVTGGTRNTTVNIRFNDMVGSMHFEGGVQDNESELRQRVVEILASVLGVAETAV